MRILMVVVLALVPKNDCGTSKEATKEVATSAASNSADVVDVTARQLFADYDANEVSADDKYKGKILRVSGTIETIGKDVLDTPFVEFATTGGLGVQCMFDDKGELGTLKKGQKLTVRCKGDGKLGNVILRGCMIDK